MEERNHWSRFDEGRYSGAYFGCKVPVWIIFMPLSAHISFTFSLEFSQVQWSYTK